ncbi:IS4 family transposase [Halorhodospira halochloris]|uniref:IS4 family transposase n=1 Tax=Halorhodospira halochloris TaxID=1052 RepID=UPI0030B85449
MRLWEELLEAEHFLGSGPLVGRRLRYLVRSENFGDVAALAFSAPALRLGARDGWIGWSDVTRAEHLDRVVCNTRFLVRGHLRVSGLASHVLGQILRRLPEDWAAKYGEPPVLVETFIDRSRHRGGCYRAANFIYIGDTAGRGRNDRYHEGGAGAKAVYLYPLCSDWRRRLGAPEQPPCTPDIDDWARHEFAHVSLGDQRLQQRLIRVGRALAAQPTASLPQACGNRAATQAAYRLFAHPRVTMNSILGSHYQATVSRCHAEPVVLAVQDTTTLNYVAHPLSEAGFGPIGSRADGAHGLIVHDTLAINPSGTPLGLIDVQAWARETEDHGLRRLGSDEWTLDNKESGKWTDSHQRASELQQQLDTGTRVVSVADREGDLFELLTAATDPERADLLVRAKHDRPLADGSGRLFGHMKALDAAGVQELTLPKRGNQKARTTRMAVTFDRVTLQPPKNKRGQEPVTLDVIRTTEINPPKGAQPVTWTLLSTVPVETLEDACERLAWYTKRWQIEVYHRTLKSGCRIEERQLGSADSLEACLGVDLVVAWRVSLLTHQSREDPNAPCTVFFTPDQWKALWVRTGAEGIPEDNDEPTLREATRTVATLGGFLGRRSDGEPGAQALWKGLQRLDDITEMFCIMIERARSGRAPP